MGPGSGLSWSNPMLMFPLMTILGPKLTHFHLMTDSSCMDANFFTTLLSYLTSVKAIRLAYFIRLYLGSSTIEDLSLDGDHDLTGLPQLILKGLPKLKRFSYQGRTMTTEDESLLKACETRGISVIQSPHRSGSIWFNCVNSTYFTQHSYLHKHSCGPECKSSRVHEWGGVDDRRMNYLDGWDRIVHQASDNIEYVFSPSFLFILLTSYVNLISVLFSSLLQKDC
jgi:hypothetical protein